MVTTFTWEAPLRPNAASYGVGLNLELLNHVEAGRVVLTAGAELHVDDAIDHRRVRSGIRSIRGEASAGFVVESGVGSASLHTRREEGQREILAAVQRKLDDLLVVDHLADRRVFTHDNLGRGVDRHLLRDVSDLESDVNPRMLIYLENNSPNGLSVEPRAQSLSRCIRRV